MGSYTAAVGTKNAAWLARKDADSLLGGTSLTIADNGDGTVTMPQRVVDYLAGLPDHYDGHVSRDAEGALLWIEGDGYDIRTL